MYISEFAAGVFTTLFVEFSILIGGAVISTFKNKKK